jgi:putative cell wall-binding protein
MRNLLVALAMASSLLAAAPIASAGASSSDVDIVILGGTAVVSSEVQNHINSCTDGAVIRIAGNDRYATAAAVSRAAFESATVAYLAVGTSYPEAVAAGPIAALRNAPLLLTRTESLPPTTRSEMQRLGISEVVILGGTGSVSSAVETDLAATYAVTRISGSDRYSTVAAISASHFQPGAIPVAYIARGDLFVDALAGGPAAVAHDGPILLTDQSLLPSATAAELNRLKPGRIEILGGTAAVSSGVEDALGQYTTGSVKRLAGSNRYATAATISSTLPAPPSTIYLATSLNYPDALAAVPLAGTDPLLLVTEKAVPGDTANRIAALTGKPCNPRVRVSTFTTSYTPGQARNTNIQHIADATDGAIVAPGETFSLNAHVGQRTVEKGYVAAPAIINGKIYCCDSPVNIGGGTSQFATTLYNAVFFGGYEDVYHRPHSIYFSRYPMGREATLGWTSPDVKFRNDTPTPVMIDTSYTSNSLTVDFWGWNEGRIITAGVSGWATTAAGGDIAVTRDIRHANGTVTTERWRHTYKPLVPID